MDPFAPLADRYHQHLLSLRGRLRQELVDRRLLEHVPAPPARILDYGGGDGSEAVRWAARGYEVALVDPSEEMLDRARARLEASGPDIRSRVVLLRTDRDGFGDALAGATFDVVLCHGVLMYEPASEPIITVLLDATSPSGVLSLLTKNAAALAMRPALEGKWQEAIDTLATDRTVGGLGQETRGDTLEDLEHIVTGLGARIDAWYGVRVFTDHLGDMAVDDVPFERVLELELRGGHQDPYRGLARLLHVVVRH